MALSKPHKGAGSRRQQAKASHAKQQKATAGGPEQAATGTGSQQALEELDGHTVFLVEAGQESGMRQAIEDLVRDWERRVELRMLGLMAAYDLVGTTQPEG